MLSNEVDENLEDLDINREISLDYKGINERYRGDSQSKTIEVYLHN